MKSSILYRSSLREAIPLDIAKGLLKNWDKTRLADWFDGKNRVYVPLVKKVSDEEKVYSGIQLTIKDMLEKEGYEIKDYQTGVIVNKKYNREEKLGRILQKLSKELLASYNLDPTRQGSKSTEKDPIVVISRNPYDIYGMSTDRPNWDSCKNMGTKKIYGKIENIVGQNAKYMQYEILHVLIAYLISPKDKNIENPIARVLMLPYLNDKKEVGFVVASDVYPLNNVGAIENTFVKTVKEWLDSKQGKLVGKYKIDPFVYNYKSRKTINFKDNPDDEDSESLESLYQIDENYIEGIESFMDDNNYSLDNISNVIDMGVGVTISFDDQTDYMFLTDAEADREAISKIESYLNDEYNFSYISGWEDYIRYGYFDDQMDNEAEKLSFQGNSTYDNELVERCYDENLIDDDDFRKIVEIDDEGNEVVTDEPDYMQCKFDNWGLIEKYTAYLNEKYDSSLKWYIQMFGEEDLKEMVSNDHRMIDIEGLARSVIELDGRGGIATYDGEENNYGDIYVYRME